MLNDPLPLAVQLEPAEAVHVHVADVSTTGSVSVTTTGAVPVRGYGPLLVATTVYVTVCPGITGLEPTFFVTLTSMHCDPVLVPAGSVMTAVADEAPAAPAVAP